MPALRQLYILRSNVIEEPFEPRTVELSWQCTKCPGPDLELKSLHDHTSNWGELQTRQMVNLLEIAQRYVEIPILLGLLVIYLAFYFRGRKINHKHSVTVFRALGPAVEAHFARVGSYTTPLQNSQAAVVEETSNLYYTFVSGNNSTLGALIQVKLSSRQELFTYLTSFYDPSLEFDSLTLNFFFPRDAIDTFSWGFYRTLDKGAYLPMFRELTGRDVPQSKPSSVDSRFSCVTEAKELIDDPLIPNDILKSLVRLDKPESPLRGLGLVSISLTDDATGAHNYLDEAGLARLENELRKRKKQGDTEPINSFAATVAQVPGACGLLQLVFRIPIPTVYEPEAAEVDAALQQIMHTSMRIVDIVTRRKLSKAGRQLVLAIREAPLEKARREIMQKIQAEAKAQRLADEAKRKAEAYQKMTPEQRKKADEQAEKERAKEQKRSLQRKIVRM